MPGKMDKAFGRCVALLEALAARLNMSYEVINVWIFVIIEPIVFLVMLWIIYQQHVVIVSLKHSMLP